jgi:hypothetical protein
MEISKGAHWGQRTGRVSGSSWDSAGFLGCRFLRAGARLLHVVSFSLCFSTPEFSTCTRVSDLWGSLFPRLVNTQ